MFRFLCPKLDGTVMDFAIGAADLQAAFEQFARDWWRPEMTGSFGVWQNHALVARVLVAMDKNTGDLVPFMQELAAVAPSQANRFACGD